MTDWTVRADPCTPEVASPAWRRCLEGLRDPEQYFMPGISLELHPGEQHYLLTAAGQPIGLAWQEPHISKIGHVRKSGFSLFPEWRGRGLPASVSKAVTTAIFEQYPETETLVAYILSSNPHARWRKTQEGRGQWQYVGEILQATPAGASLHCIQITRTAWRGWAKEGLEELESTRR